MCKIEMPVLHEGNSICFQYANHTYFPKVLISKDNAGIVEF